MMSFDTYNLMGIFSNKYWAYIWVVTHIADLYLSLCEYCHMTKVGKTYYTLATL